MQRKCSVDVQFASTRASPCRRLFITAITSTHRSASRNKPRRSSHNSRRRSNSNSPLPHEPARCPARTQFFCPNSSSLAQHRDNLAAATVPSQGLELPLKRGSRQTSPPPDAHRRGGCQHTSRSRLPQALGSTGDGRWLPWGALVVRSPEELLGRQGGTTRWVKRRSRGARCLIETVASLPEMCPRAGEAAAAAVETLPRVDLVTIVFPAGILGGTLPR